LNIQKYSGAGNKFVILNNLNNKYPDYEKIVSELVTDADNGEADGVIFLEKSSTGDFKMNYFNKDGSGNSLCGNGLRCTMKYINDNLISKANELKLEAVSKIYLCKNNADGKISVTFPPPVKIKTNFKLKVALAGKSQLLNCSFVDCGSPHAVIFIDDIETPKVNNLDEINIIDWGRLVRMHNDFMPGGVNVNFVKVNSDNDGQIEIRSYERGVEGETLACGTGAISSALIYYILKKQIKPVKVKTKSEEILLVDFKISDKKLTEVNLTGSAERYFPEKSNLKN